ncbi:hypothetical protein J2S89_001480 [Arthrobacter bambusae]|nr:hypothetical protein [Arthrobacter bambusae]MDQ0097319.1 hypothetical protein [Arthrobacter bambusae]
MNLRSIALKTVGAVAAATAENVSLIGTPGDEADVSSVPVRLGRPMGLVGHKRGFLRRDGLLRPHGRIGVLGSDGDCRIGY